ncbi:expressed unknown protein [Seminavis robusta]|uniref:Uncharacterized protein n=1 Tax=Seminavis robusta TaxID=568900 RepID=A0A9N8EH36_9STRA|nr:expressed unknown protein [Seminavis robusta]|eukprot:Sro1193_g251160.1 n/a (305) ;mRNA; f:8791-9705
MILLANTSFPRFIFDDNNKFVPSPDLDETSISDNDEAEERVKKFEQFKCREDQDVAVFLSIANKMDVSSLIFILQGHAKAQALPAAAQAQAAAKISGKPTTPQKAVAKQFRFALANNDMVKCVYHVVPSVKDNPDMWWSDVEMKQIRGAAIQDVKYYRKYRADFRQTVELLANAGINEGVFTHATVEANLKKLMEDSYARGLEVHIVNLLSDLRKETVRAVLEEQAECRMCGDAPDITAESLREQSMAYTLQSRTFALKLAQCDQVESLKASLSSSSNRWDNNSNNDTSMVTPDPIPEPRSACA